MEKQKLYEAATQLAKYANLPIAHISNLQNIAFEKKQLQDFCSQAFLILQNSLARDYKELNIFIEDKLNIFLNIHRQWQELPHLQQANKKTAEVFLKKLEEAQFKSTSFVPKAMKLEDKANYLEELKKDRTFGFLKTSSRVNEQILSERGNYLKLRDKYAKTYQKDFKKLINLLDKISNETIEY